MSVSAVELGFLDDFLGSRVLVFVNGFWASSRLCTLKILASAVELCFEVDICDSMDSVFVNGLSVRNSLFFAEDVSVSRRTGLLGWFLDPRDLVFVNGFWGSSSVCRLMISASAVELGFEDDFWDRGTQFSTTIFLFEVVYLRRRFQRQRQR
jgi:hypothetical protein